MSEGALAPARAPAPAPAPVPADAVAGRRAGPGPAADPPTSSPASPLWRALALGGHGVGGPGVGGAGVGDPDDGHEQAARRRAEQVVAAMPPVPRAAVRPPDPRPGGVPLDPLVRNVFEQGFGGPVPDVRLHHDAASAELAAGLRARAFTVATEIVLPAGAYAPHTPEGARLLAHELSHVVDGAPGVHRMTDFQYDVQAERAERRAAAQAAAEARTAQWRQVVAGQVRADLGGQSGDLATDLERSALAVSSSRVALLTRVAASLPSGFAQTWATARLSMELLHAAPTRPAGATEPAAREAAPAPSDDVQQFVRDRVLAFYFALRSWEVTRYQNAVAAARNEYLVWRMNQLSVAGTRFADHRPPPGALPPPAPDGTVRARLAGAQAASTAADWAAVARGFEDSTGTVDEWAADLLAPDSPERQALEQAKGLHRRQQELEAAGHVDARKIPAVFYPKDRSTSQDGVTRAESFPWFFYLYRVPGEARWYLEDLTAPDKKVNVEDDSLAYSVERVYRMIHHIPLPVNPPESLWEQLNSRLRFPEGELHLTLPDGTTYRLVTTASRTWADYLGMAAMAVGAVTLVLFTAGAATPGVLAALSVTAAGLGVSSTLLNLADLEEQGMATSGDRAKAALMVAVDLASALTGGLGRVARGAATAGETASFGMRLAGRLYVPVARLSVALDLTQLYVMTSDFVAQYEAVSRQPGLTDDERSSARRRIVLLGLATGSLSLWTVRSTLREMKTLRPVTTDELVPPGSGPTAPRPPGAATGTAASAAPRTTDLRLGRAQMVVEPQLVPELPPGTIQVQLRRNRLGLVSEIAVVHGPPTSTFAADMVHHQLVAAVAQRYSGLVGEIRELLERLAGRLVGRPRGPLEMELDLAKLEGRIQDRLRRLADPRGITETQRRAFEQDVVSFRNQIQARRAAIERGDAATGIIAQQGTPAGHPAAPPGYTYHYDAVQGRWVVVPDLVGLPRLAAELDAATGAATGRFTNADQVAAQGILGRPVTEPTVPQQLSGLGYVLDPQGGIRPAPGLPPAVAEAMVPLRAVGGTVEVVPRVHVDASTVGTSAFYRRYWGGTLDTETLVARHGTSRQRWQTEFVPVGPALKRAGAETLWRPGSRYGLVDYVRYHILGPGTGLERHRILLAPEAANQFANNHIEGFLRTLRDSGTTSRLSFRVTYEAFSGPELRSFIDAMLSSGDQRTIRQLLLDQGRFEYLLKYARYDISVVDRKGVETLYQASVTMGVPGTSMRGTVNTVAPVQVTQF